MEYIPASDRYDKIQYRRCGRSGIKLPEISLGLWQNFGHVDRKENIRDILLAAFDAGINHFDLANNYGPPPGSAEENFGRVLKQDLSAWRDELIISSKAGYLMWPGPYGDFGSRKYLLASLDQSLLRMGLEYVDIFYHHRPDPETPLEESMMALDQAVRSGKALYAGISNYPPDLTEKASAILRSLGTPCLIHQPKYSMLVRTPEDGLLNSLEAEGIGCIPFSPLAQGLLTSRYLDGIPEGSRASRDHFLKKSYLSEEVLLKIGKLNKIAISRKQSLAQMAIAWLLKDKRVTSVLIGASSVNQLLENLEAVQNTVFSDKELSRINEILK